MSNFLLIFKTILSPPNPYAGQDIITVSSRIDITIYTLHGYSQELLKQIDLLIGEIRAGKSPAIIDTNLKILLDNKQELNDSIFDSSIVKAKTFFAQGNRLNACKELW